MPGKLLHLAAAGLLIIQLGCSQNSQENIKDKLKGQQGGQSKAQSQSSGSALDEELKRQGKIYKELLNHNAENAQKHLEADRKLLRQMEKNDQQTRQRVLRTLQERSGLIQEDNQDASSGNKPQSSQKQGDTGKQDQGSEETE